MVNIEILQRAYQLMCTAGAMASLYDQQRGVCKYVHSTSRGHEAIQLAAAFHLQPIDYVSPYYRDESLLLGLGFSPYELMLQLLAKGGDPFTGGREYYSHPNYRGQGKPTIIHQSSATGMQAIPSTGIAQGVAHREKLAQLDGQLTGERPVVICSLGDASITEGEVSEAFQFAALHQLPIIYLVQDNDWGISVTAQEARTSNAYEFIRGFKGIERITIDGSQFEDAYLTMEWVMEMVRQHRQPCLLHAKVPLLGHHTSGVRKEFYRNAQELEKEAQRDPVLRLRELLLGHGISADELDTVAAEARRRVQGDFERACAAAEPHPDTVESHVFCPTTIIEEKGERSPAGKEKIIMVDAALFAIREIMEQHPEALLYGQDVGRRLGGVFREAATLAEQFGDHRVFNTAIQEAYIIGSTAGMCATGLKPIVEVQFGDYIYPGFNQLVTELSKSCYLSCGKFPIQTVIRIPVGAYGGGGPYHSGCIETTLLSIKGIKVVYPSNAADMKGLMKAAFYDPNPVVMLEHKGLYWSKVPGTEGAKCVEPSADYIIPLGKARIALPADEDMMDEGSSCCVITYGMGVYWAMGAAEQFYGMVEVIDLRTLYPLDEEFIFERVRQHGKCLVLTEEQQNNSFAEALAARISKACFRSLDTPVEVMGALNLPAVPMNTGLEEAMLPNRSKVAQRLADLLNY